MDESAEPTQALRPANSEASAAAMDDFVVGGPEPSDWVRLQEDPRSAPTVPSLRRRVGERVHFDLDDPDLTPIDPSAERRRERFQRWIAFGLGGLLAMLAVGFALVSSRNEGDAPVPALATTIDAARTARVDSQPARAPAPDPVVIPAPPPLPADSDAPEVSEPALSDAEAAPGVNAPAATSAAAEAAPGVNAPAATSAAAEAATPPERAPQVSTTSAPRAASEVTAPAGAPGSSGARVAPRNKPRPKLWFPPE